MLNLTALKKTNATTTPFSFLIVPNFLTKQACAEVNADFPDIQEPGSFPLSELTFGTQFQTVINQLQDAPFRALIEEKFGVDLTDRPTMVTVRGRSQMRDGQIHTDSKTKIITVLVYMNSAWEPSGGRLRLLYSPDNINDYIAEVPPHEGTLLAFKVTPNAWHGHLPFEGQRRVIQLNWVINDNVVRREQFRHRVSAKIKFLKRWLSY